MAPPSHAKEKLVTTMTPPRLRTGNWVVNEAHSHATFAAWVAGRTIRGRLPLTGQVVVAESIEDSSAVLVARASEVNTGSPVLDGLLKGPGFLEAGAFPEITFRSELLASVPGGWRAVGRMTLKGIEHELACQLDLQGQGVPHFRIASRWVIDSRWVTGQRIPAMSRRIPMSCAFLLERGT